MTRAASPTAPPSAPGDNGYGLSVVGGKQGGDHILFGLRYEGQSPTLDLNDAGEDPQIRATGLFTVVQHPTEGAYRHVAEPARLSASPTGLFRFAPRLGEHTREALREVGWDDAAIDALLTAGAARQADPA